MTINTGLLKETMQTIADLDELRQSQKTQKALAPVEEMPQQWYQGAWRMIMIYCDEQHNACGTAMCFAGWAVQLDGTLEYAVSPELWLRATRAYNQAEEGSDEQIRAAELHEWATDYDDYVVVPEGMDFPADLVTTTVHPETQQTLSVTTIASAARYLLGLDMDQSSLLFSGSNSRSMLEHIVEGLQEGRSTESVLDSVHELRRRELAAQLAEEVR